MLSEPLAFSYAGWICGTLLIVLYGMITCYTYVTGILDLTYVLANDMIPSKREIFGRRCDLRLARSDLCGHWEESIWSAFNASRKFHVLLRDIQCRVSFTVTPPALPPLHLWMDA